MQTTFDAKFFQVLKTVFDDFSASDLQRAFRDAESIRCADLLGEWRPAAFLNDDPNLERWFYKTFGEVQAELTRYTFRGTCNSEFARVDVTSRFPFRDSLAAYNSQRIGFDKIAFKTNAVVRATFESRTRTYSFELPYLYVTGRQNGTNQYSLVPPNEAMKPAPEVTNQWDCKAVRAQDTTYRFLLCRTAILPRNSAIRSQAEEVRGTSAYVILTDGKEAVSTFTLSFEDSPAESPAKAVSKIVDLIGEKFRLQFSRRSWNDSIDSVMVLVRGRLESPGSAATANSDYCEWIPQSPITSLVVSDTDRTVEYYLSKTEPEGQSPAAVFVEARTSNNIRLGTLRCFFPNADAVANVSMDRLKAILGEHVTVDVR